MEPKQTKCIWIERWVFFHWQNKKLAGDVANELQQETTWKRRGKTKWSVLSVKDPGMYEYIKVDFMGKPNPPKNSNDYIVTIAVWGLWWERQKRTQCSTEVVDHKEMKHDSLSKINAGWKPSLWDMGVKWKRPHRKSRHLRTMNTVA